MTNETGGAQTFNSTREHRHDAGRADEHSMGARAPEEAGCA